MSLFLLGFDTCLLGIQIRFMGQETHVTVVQQQPGCDGCGGGPIGAKVGDGYDDGRGSGLRPMMAAPQATGALRFQIHITSFPELTCT
jgi:hypothetical protein